MKKYICEKKVNNNKTHYTFYSPELVDLCGSVVAALVFARLLFLSRLTCNPEGWIWKSYTQWFEETRLTENQVRHAVRILVQKGLIETKIMKACAVPTLHYRIIAPPELLEAACLPDWLWSGCVYTKSENVCSSFLVANKGDSLDVAVIDKLMQLVPLGGRNKITRKLIEKYASHGEAYIKSQIEYVNKRSLKKGGYPGYLAVALEKDFAAHNASSHADYSSPIKLPRDGEVVLYQGYQTEVQDGMIFDQAGRAINPARLLSLIATGEVKLLNEMAVN